MQTDTTAETVYQTYQTLLAARLTLARTVTAYLAGQVDRWELAAVSAAETRAHEAWTAAAASDVYQTYQTF